MNGYEHDLGREKTNLDVFYTILNFIFAQNTYFAKNLKCQISSRIRAAGFLERSIILIS